jgi:membrane-associated protease RseP (regulator of RpoE activity)
VAILGVATAAALATGSAHAVADPRTGDKTKLVYIDADGEQKVIEGVATQVKRGYLGVELTELTPELRTHFGAPANAGVMIARVVPGSPAEKAGLQVGDILTTLDGKTIESSWDVRSMIRTLDAGTALTLDVQRDGEALALKASVEQRERREVDYAPLMMKTGDADRILGFCTAPESAAEKGEKTEKGEKSDGAAVDTAKAAPVRVQLQPPVSPREELLAKRLKALEKRLNELESRLPKN